MLGFLIVKGLDLSHGLTPWSFEAHVCQSLAMDEGHRVRYGKSILLMGAGQ